MTNQGNLKIGGLGHHQEVALMDWEWIVPTALFVTASTALSGTTRTGFSSTFTALSCSAATGTGLRLGGLSCATGTGFDPPATALARRFILLGAACTRVSTSTTLPFSGKTVGYKCSSREKTGNTEPCQDFF